MLGLLYLACWLEGRVSLTDYLVCSSACGLESDPNIQAKCLVFSNISKHVDSVVIFSNGENIY